jgi:hypothetical protein
MRPLLIGVLLFVCALPAYPQGSRVQGPISTTTALGSINVLIPVSSGTVNFCAYPNIGIPCVNLVTTYTDATLGTPCSTFMQVVLDGTNVCTSTTDSQGNWGVWVPAGNYTYTVTSSAGIYGPFFVTAAAISGGGGGGSVNSVGASSPLISSGGATPNISCPTCTNNTSNLPAGSLVVGLSGFQTVQSLADGTAHQLLHGSNPHTWGAVDLTTEVSNLLPVANGGTGTASPALVPGSNITITGAWPNQTITSTNTAATAWSAITASTNSNAGTFAATGNTFDFSGVTLLKLRVGAGATTSANGDQAYDTTNKNWHIWSNAVDNINLLMPVSVSPANNDCAKYSVAAGVITITTAGGPCSLTPPFSGITSSTNTSAAMVVGTGASINATGSGAINATNSPLVNGNNIIKRGIFMAATCNNATASPVWDLPTSNAPLPSCNTGTNVQEGTLQFADASNAQIGFALPEDWTGAIDFKIYFFDVSTAGTVIFNVATACTPVNGSVTDDTAFNTADALGTVTLGATSNALWVASKTGVNTTGCAAGNDMRMKITRVTDTAIFTAHVIKAQVTIRGTNSL